MWCTTHIINRVFCMSILMHVFNAAYACSTARSDLWQMHNLQQWYIPASKGIYITTHWISRHITHLWHEHEALPSIWKSPAPMLTHGHQVSVQHCKPIKRKSVMWYMANILSLNICIDRFYNPGNLFLSESWTFMQAVNMTAAGLRSDNLYIAECTLISYTTLQILQ